MAFHRFPRLRERSGQLAGTLSGGEQPMLAIARPLMSEPRLLMVDEPNLGLSPMRAGEGFGVVLPVNQHGLPILLDDTHIHHPLRVGSRTYVVSTARNPT